MAAALVDDLATPTRLLAARRRVPAQLAVRWEFPGGKVEGAETPVAALHRELDEELGVTVRLGAEVVPAAGGPWVLSEHYVLRLWWAQIVRGTPVPLVEHDELRWLAIGSWLTVPWLDADLPIVEALVRRG